MPSISSLCVFCGASNAVDPKFLAMGADLGALMAKNKIKLVYGGGDCGVMGAVANSTLKNGGHVTGVFPISLRNIENEHQNLSEIVIVGSMHERKKLMFDLSQGFVVLPGGFGTLDEMFEILTWRQLLLHEKPVVIVNYEGYWNPLITLMDEIVRERFARMEVASFYQVANTPQQAMALLKE